MTNLAAAISIGTTPTLVSDPDELMQPLPVVGHSLLLKVPPGGVTVYVGGAGVTTATGYPLPPGVEFGADLVPTSPLYAVVAAGSQVVNVFWSGI